MYPRNAEPSLDSELFRQPTSEYRGTPFWSWNTRLDRDQLLRQIDILKAMGMGGFHMHPRTGLATAYLGDAFMALVRACTERAHNQGMLAWLYDEDRWPSGFAGGLVTRDAQHRAKHLLYTTRPYDGTVETPPLISNAKAARFENGLLLARHHVVLEDGRLASYRRLTDGEPAPNGGRVWYAYLETAEPSPWWNNQTYADTLSRATTERFIEVTHERYRAAVGEFFGSTVPAIFTDEPQFVHKVLPERADAARDVFLPWTTDFSETHRAAYGTDPLETLPEVFWERGDGSASVSRYRFHDHLAERFASAFADTLGAWCSRHSLMLTGHMMEEPRLESQTAALGEAMRSYRSFHLPGVGMLCDRREYTTVKQAQSAARQYGRPGVLSELYGVTNWDFDFRGHKAQGDWQAALGVTTRVHHLAWVSMAGEAKRDYPASIFYQSPWWREYPLVEDHFARLNTVLTRGRAVCRVAVVHPVESYWLAYGPLEHTKAERDARERAFAELTKWLLFGLIDFDFLAESLLPDLCSEAANPLPVGASRYDVVVPGLRTVRSSTLARLERFRDAGGTVVFAGGVPPLVDAAPSDRPARLAERSRRVAFSKDALLGALEPWREVSGQHPDGSPSDALLHQLREDGPRRHLFVCNADKNGPRAGVRLAVKGAGQPTELDTMTGEIKPCYARLEAGWTVLERDLPAHGHALVTFEPGTPAARPAPARRSLVEVGRLADPVPVILSEPNVLLLDRAEFRLDNGPWEPEEEVLRLDNTLRRRLGWPLRMDALAQPWTDPHAPADRTLHLRFRFRSDLPIAGARLALEEVGSATIRLDGKPVAAQVSGWWVDESILTVPLPPLEPGEHVLELATPYGRQSNPEWCYLLGDFGVEVRGRHAKLTAPVRELAFGDWTRQGLPFYAGNVTYRCVLEGDGRALTLEAARFRAPLLSVALDSRELGKVAFAPYQVGLGVPSAGLHTLDITAYGSRVNAFGPLRNADEHALWFGPDAWRTAGPEWADEYQLRPAGVLVAPRLLARAELPAQAQGGADSVR